MSGNHDAEKFKKAVKGLLRMKPSPHKGAAEPLVVRLSLDASPAVEALADARERFLEVSDGSVGVPESALDAIGFNLDPLPASGAGDFTYAARVTGLDGVLSAASGARKS